MCVSDKQLSKNQHWHINILVCWLPLLRLSLTLTYHYCSLSPAGSFFKCICSCYTLRRAGERLAWKHGGAFHVQARVAQAQQETQAARCPAQVLLLQGDWADPLYSPESFCCNRQVLPDPHGGPCTSLLSNGSVIQVQERPAATAPAHGGKGKLQLST